MSTGLDIERAGDLVGYLWDTGRIGAGEAPRVSVLAGGVSNRTVLVERESGEAWVLKQALAKLRVAVDWFSDPRRVEREALGIRYLSEIVPGSVPPLVFEDPAENLLAMQAVPSPHRNWKTMLLAGEVEQGHVEQFGRMLGAIHREGSRRRVELGQVFGDRSFFESLRVEPYYLYTRMQVAEASGFIKELVTDTRLRQLSLVHGDYSPKNILVHEGRLILLDHEVIHFGDPAFDLGFSMAHLLSKGHHLPEHRGVFLKAVKDYWRAYRAALGEVRWGGDLEELAVRHTLGCMLARVAGRSPLEYLTAGQRDWQKSAVLAMMADLPGSIDELAETFLERE